VRPTRVLMLLSTLVVAVTLALPTSPANATGPGSVYAGGCALASFTLTGTTGPINRLPGPVTMSLHITGSLCAVNNDVSGTAVLDVPLSSSSFGCFDGIASGTGQFAATNISEPTVGVTLVNAGGSWTVIINRQLSFVGAATGLSVPVGCSLGTPAPQLTALGSLAFEDPELPS
jgi:hypothetical protein